MARVDQELLIPLVEYKVWKGIDNQTTDDMRLKPGFVRTANNVDFDEEEMVHRREGILEEILSGNWHSLWSDGDSLCYGIKVDDLRIINTDWTTSSTHSSVGTSKMSYVPVGDRIFYSNNSLVIGYIKNKVSYNFPEADRTMRQKMVGGELLEYYNGRLYASQGDGIYCSVAYSPMEMEIKRNFIMLGGPITMMHAVVDGIYISAGNTISFHHGSDLFDMKYKELLNVPAIKGSPIVVEKMVYTSTTLKDRAIGKCVLFSTSIGIFMGMPGGELKNLTGDYYAVDGIEDGSALIRWYGNYKQYVFMAQAPAEIAGIDGSIEFPLLSIEATTL